MNKTGLVFILDMSGSMDHGSSEDVQYSPAPITSSHNEANYENSNH